MATKPWASAFLDPALAILDDATYIALCSQDPVTYTEAYTTYKLAGSVISAANFTGPFNGLVSGRRLHISSIPDATGLANGDATHYALVITASSTLLYTGPLVETYTIVTSATITFGTIDIELPDTVIAG